MAARAGADFIGVIFAKSKRKLSAAQAREIVLAVRKYREQKHDGPVELAPPPPPPRPEPAPASASEGEAEAGVPASVVQWYQRWAAELGRKCDSNRCRPLVVGVFMNQPAEEVRRIVEESGVDLAQLHGSEGFEAADPAICGVPCFRVVHMAAGGDGVAEASAQRSAKVAAMLRAGPPAALLLDTKVKGAAGGTGVTFDWGVAGALSKQGLPLIVAGGLNPDNVAEAVRQCRPWAVDVSSGVEEGNGSIAKDHAKIRAFVVAAKASGLELAAQGKPRAAY